jgi:glutamate synthase domain-containing protein 1
MTQVPWDLFPSDFVDKDSKESTACGMLFMPRNLELQAVLMARIESVFKKAHFNVKGWRDVPTDDSMLGPVSKEHVPDIKQIIVHSGSSTKVFDKRLYNARREIQNIFREFKCDDDAYVCSLSRKVIVYKGMLRSADLSKFFLDLTNPLSISSGSRREMASAALL